MSVPLGWVYGTSEWLVGHNDEWGAPGSIVDHNISDMPLCWMYGTSEWLVGHNDISACQTDKFIIRHIPYSKAMLSKMYISFIQYIVYRLIKL